MGTSAENTAKNTPPRIAEEQKSEQKQTPSFDNPIERPRSLSRPERVRTVSNVSQSKQQPPRKEISLDLHPDERKYFELQSAVLYFERILAGKI